MAEGPEHDSDGVSPAQRLANAPSNLAGCAFPVGIRPAELPRWIAPTPRAVGTGP